MLLPSCVFFACCLSWFLRNIGSHLIINKTVDSCINTENHVTSLEHVQARLTLSYNRRGNLAIHLISPAGTRSTLLHPRYEDSDKEKQDTLVNTQTKIINKWNAPGGRSAAGLMITRQRVSTTGLSWPPTPGMRTPLGCGRLWSRMWPVPVTMVTHLFWLKKFMADGHFIKFS